MSATGSRVVQERNEHPGVRARNANGDRFLGTCPMPRSTQAMSGHAISRNPQTVPSGRCRHRPAFSDSEQLTDPGPHGRTVTEPGHPITVPGEASLPHYTFLETAIFSLLVGRDWTPRGWCRGSADETEELT